MLTSLLCPCGFVGTSTCVTVSPSGGCAAWRCGFLPGKGAHILLILFPFSCPACGSPPTWSPPAPWCPWSGWTCSLPSGPRCPTMSCSTRRWMSTRTQTSTQVGVREGNLLVLQRAPGDASCALPGWELQLWWRTVHRAKVLHEVSNPLLLGEVSGIFCRHGYLRGRGITKMQ